MPTEHDLEREWQALRQRDYGEEGIPMIIGVECVGSTGPHAGEPDLAAEFHALAEALGDGADPAAILELIAVRRLRRLG